MTILQYCSVCKTEYEMSVVPTADDDDVLWLQCPNCKGFLPKVDGRRDRDQAAEPATASEQGQDAAAVGDPALADPPPSPKHLEADDPEPEPEPDEDDEGLELLASMDVSQAVVYRPWNDHAVGDVLHHPAWDDYGVVLAKEVLPGNRRVAKVRFAEAGVVRLIEAQGEPPS